MICRCRTDCRTTAKKKRPDRALFLWVEAPYPIYALLNSAAEMRLRGRQSFQARLQGCNAPRHPASAREHVETNRGRAAGNAQHAAYGRPCPRSRAQVWIESLA